ncbi:MAG: T9SS type A sorting domain-containing protein [Bacteroidales bacterium]|nr:T9SS type A sorting domain-containing protein [Bacteroidales bacterium]
MKKILLLIAASIMALSMSYAQKLEGKTEFKVAEPATVSRDLPVWGTFTNFEQADMNGTVHNIQNYLDQGKYVIIDFFCAWCGPCYNFHSSGKFETLYNTYGQGGTGEMVILMVECETTNTAAQISGTTTAQTYAGASAGDFTNGGTNPIPMIDATSNYAWNVSIYEGYVPSIYLFCPSGFVTDVYSTGILSNYSAAEVLEFAQSNCPNEADPPLAEILLPNVVKMGEGATLNSSVVSIADVTYAWTFEGATPATATTASVNNVIWDEAGEYEVTLTVTNANGVATDTKTVTVVDCNGTISEFPFVEDFEHGIGCWTTRSMNTANAEDFGVVEYLEGMYGFMFSSYNQASNYNQYLISQELVHTGALDLTFDYATVGYNEKFKVKYSTTDKEISSFVDLGNEMTVNTNGLPFQTYSGTLPADAKYFMINYSSNYMYYLYIDDIRIEANHETSIEDAVSSNVQIYPNPTNGILNVEAEGLNNVEIIDVTGRVIVSSTESSIDLSNVEAGVYFVKAYTENGSIVKKVVKE